jgi:hypothetical protein
MTAEQAEILRDAVAWRCNILVAGGTSTGKTTLVNALLAEVAWTADRVVLIEDTRELQCKAPNLVALRTKDGVASLSDLVRSSLRLRPDRIPIGEVRGAEALDLLKAWGTGHPGGIGTIHAGSAIGALRRLEQLIQEAVVTVPRALIAETINLIAVLAAHRLRQPVSCGRACRRPDLATSRTNGCSSSRSRVASQHAGPQGRLPQWPVDRKTVSPDRLENPASRYVVQAGAVIAAALITGILSDLPGQVTAQVTETVYDSPSGRFLLIPQGAKLVGAYDSQISFGQDRILLVWTRLIMPNGRSIVLERQPGADTQGFTGLEDEVDQHWGRLAMAAALSTVLGVGAELGATNNDSAVATALRRGTTDSLNQTGQQVVSRNLNIQPTITIRPGFQPSKTD